MFTEDELKAIQCYGAMVQKLSLSAKVEIYQSIFNEDNIKADAINDELLDLGIAIVCDTDFQQWLDRNVKK